MEHAYIYFGFCACTLKQKEVIMHVILYLRLYEQKKSSFLSFMAKNILSLLFLFILMLISAMIHYYDGWT